MSNGTSSPSLNSAPLPQSRSGPVADGQGRCPSPPNLASTIQPPAPPPVAQVKLPAPAHGLNGRPAPPPLQLGNLTHRRRADPISASDGAVRARVPPPPLYPSSQQLREQPLQQANGTHGGQQNGRPEGTWRQGKPIFEWITRKFGARRGSDANERPAAEPKPFPSQAPKSGPKTQQANRPTRLPYRLGRDPRTQLSPTDVFGPKRPTRSSIDSPMRSETMSMRSYSFSASMTPSERRREENNPYPSIPVPLLRRSYPASTIDSGSRPPSMSMLSRSRTSSTGSLSSLLMNGRRPRISIADDASASSLAGRVADEDASVRPIPPSPTSMSVISRAGSVPLGRTDSLEPRLATSSPLPTADRRDTLGSSVGASHMSDDCGVQSRQDSLASTKPTTVMSFESGASRGHIAVAPHSSSPPTVTRTTSSPTATSGTSVAHGSVSSPISATFTPPPPHHNASEYGAAGVRVPVHSRYHPRNNPNPQAPPGPDASTVTLASSTYAFAPSPVDRGAARPVSLRLRDATASPSAYHAHHLGTSPTVAFADRPGSMHGDGVSTHAMSLSVRTRGYGRADDDASMRAIRRRGSWESGESRWSWRPGTSGDGPLFSPLRGRSEHADADDGGTNRSSVYTRDSYRTALTWAGEAEEAELAALASDNTGLASHRPVSVRV